MTAELTLSPSVRGRLSAMMFLQFFIWGAYFVTMGTYLLQGLKFTGTQTAAAECADVITPLCRPGLARLPSTYQPPLFPQRARRGGRPIADQRGLAALYRVRPGAADSSVT